MIRAELFAEHMRSKEIQSIEVSMAEVNNETYYRVIIGPFDQRVESLRDRHNNIGTSETWWLLEARPEPVMQPTAIASLEPSIPESVIRGPEFEESYVEYCATKANAAERDAYCSDGQVVREITKTIELLSMNDRAYSTYCTNAPGRARMRYCTDGFSDRRADR